MLDGKKRALMCYRNQYGFVQDEKGADIPITVDTIIRRYGVLNPPPPGFEKLHGFYISNGSTELDDTVPFFSEELSVIDEWVKNVQRLRGCLRTIKEVNDAMGEVTITSRAATAATKTLDKQGWLYKKPLRGAAHPAKKRLLWFQLKGPPYRLLLFTSEDAAKSGEDPEHLFHISDAWKVERSSKKQSNSALRIVSGAGKNKTVLLVVSAKRGEEDNLVDWRNQISYAARELSKTDLGLVKEGSVMRKSGPSSNRVHLTLLARANIDTGRNNNHICVLRLKHGERSKTYSITHRSTVKYARDGLGFQHDCNLELKIKKTRKLVFVMQSLDEMLQWGEAFTKHINLCKKANFGSKSLTFQALAILISENVMPESGQPLTSLHLQMVLADDPEFRNFLDDSLAGGSRALQQQVEDYSGMNDTGVMEDLVLLLTRQLLEKRQVSVPVTELPAILKLSVKGRVNTIDSLMGPAEIKLHEGMKVKLDAYENDTAASVYDFHKRFVEFSAGEVFVYQDKSRLKILHRIKLDRQRPIVERVLDAKGRPVLQVDPFFQICFHNKDQQFETDWTMTMKAMASMADQEPPMASRELEPVDRLFRGYPVRWRGRLLILTPDLLGPLPEGTRFKARPRRCILTNNRLWFQISEHGTYSFITITKSSKVIFQYLYLFGHGF